MSRVYNFSAGPAILPEAVLQKASSEMLEWTNYEGGNASMSVMEMSHRGKDFMSIAAKAEADLRKLMSIPENYKVLFLQGGASSQFAMIPMNLLAGKTTADYVNSGMWSKKAIAEAKRYCDVNVVASSEDSGFTTIPEFSSWKLNPDAAYVHYTPNETIGGVEFNYIPDTGDVPLVADMSSTILSREIDVSKFALIYAGAQKNVGPAGLTLVIIREDLIGKASDSVPAMMNYAIHDKAGSMYNTPPTYSWYLAGLVFDWVLQQGGLSAMGEINKRKANKLYAVIDELDFYANPVETQYRSWMNVPFTLAKADLDADFIKQATDAGLHTLKGHRSVGGMRASIYNAMPESGIDTLVEFMKTFAKNNS
ncbi:MAG: 3-phosphoserine/phosphohydroxythreonine transaminase [Pseudomonadota bacterium]